MTGHATRTLYRPAGSSEVALIERTDYQGFPPRLPGQPIFYPVLNFEYAEQIARDWNSTDERHGFVGFVTRFQVLESFIEPYDVQQVGGRSTRTDGAKRSGPCSRQGRGGGGTFTSSCL